AVVVGVAEDGSSRPGAAPRSKVGAIDLPRLQVQTVQDVVVDYQQIEHVDAVVAVDVAAGRAVKDIGDRRVAVRIYADTRRLTEFRGKCRLNAVQVHDRSGVVTSGGAVAELQV